MHANRPEELPLVFRHHLNAGDVAGLIADYYAPDAIYSPVPGVVLSGAELEASIARLASLRAPIEVSVRHALEGGDTALLVIDWSIPAAGMSGTATDVARRQADGSWKCVIDNPHGGAVSVDLRPEVAGVLAGRPDV